MEDIVLLSSRAALCAAISFVLSITSLAAADEPATQPTNQELLDKVSRLEAKVERLESAQGNKPADAQSANGDGTDKSAKESFLGLESIYPRFHQGQLQLSTADGRFLFHPILHLVIRNVTNTRDDANGPGTSWQTDNGFEIRRMEFGAEGNLFTKDLNYLILWDTDRHNGRPILELALAQYHFDNTPWSVKGGQIKAPFDKEQLGSSAQFVAVERTLVVDTLAAGDAFTHGASAIFDNHNGLRWETAFTDGFASANQNFQDYPANLADWGISSRAEFKLFGDWSQYEEASARGNTKPLLVVGAGVDYTEAGSTAPFRHVVDAIYKTGGLGLYGAYLGRYTRNNKIFSTARADTYDWSVRTQASYAFDQHWEPFARYSFMSLDGKTIAPGLHGSVHEITAGVNYYFYGQSAKLTGDIDYLPDGSPISDDGTGVLRNGGGTEFLLRVNFQLTL